MAKLYNLARMTTTTTGSDVITLGTAVAGRLDFETAGVSDGETISYGIVEGNNSEVGRGVYGGSGSTLTRSVLNSTNSGSPIVLGGSAHVFILALANDFSQDGWISSSESWTYASATTFTVSGDQTVTYQKGTKLKFTQTTVKYGVVVSSSEAGGTTTVTLIANDDYSVANAAISDNYYSYVENPEGYPHWFNYTPSVAAATVGNGTLTGKFAVLGKTVHTYISFVLGSTSAIASGTSFSLPTTAGSNPLANGVFFDTGTNVLPTICNCSTTVIYPYAINAASTYAIGNNLGAAIPFTWTTSDEIRLQATFDLP